MNKKERTKFWKNAVPYEGVHVPSHRFHAEWFYVATDSGYRAIDEEDLAAALTFFHELTKGEGCAIYLYRDRDLLAVYNGEQSEPHGEIEYRVTKSALGEWLAVLNRMR